MSYCTGCGQPIDEQDRFCRNCGVSATRTPETRRGPAGLTPEIAASYWKSFFRPFFKVAFIFFGCFFGFALIMVIVWFFMFRV